MEKENNKPSGYIPEEIAPYDKDPVELLEELAANVAGRSNNELLGEIRRPTQSVGAGILKAFVDIATGPSGKDTEFPTEWHVYRLVVVAGEIEFEIEVLRMKHGTGYYPLYLTAMEGSLPSSPYIARNEETLEYALSAFGRSDEFMGLLRTLVTRIHKKRALTSSQ